MKLRIEGHSIRLRLKQHEVVQLSGQQTVSQQLKVGPEPGFTYELRSSFDSGLPAVQMGDRSLKITLPSAWTGPWAENDQVGFTFEIPNGTPSGLKVVVEKDFKCLTPRGHEDLGAYPHPEMHNGHG